MILAAGRGERLRPLTDRIPKPLAPVGGEPLIVHQVRWLAAANIRDLVINLHHLGAQIEDLLGDGRDLGVHIRYSREPELLDTGGGIVNALPLLGEGFFAVLNGDIYTDFPFSRLPSTLPEDVDAHLVLTPRPGYRDKGDFEYLDGEVVDRGNSHVYCGICVLRAETFAGRPVRPYSLREDFFAALAAGRLGAQTWNGYWTDIGTLEQLNELNAFLGGQAIAGEPG